MIFVKQLLAQKSGDVVSVSPDATLRQAIQDMSRFDIGVVVVLENGAIKGIFSERDFTRDFANNENLNLNTPIEELMTKDVISVSPDQTIDECMKLMTERHFRHLPVTQDGVLIGLISIGDMVKELLTERDQTIRGLENYILGSDNTR
jgi:CBS domain-containing protein